MLIAIAFVGCGSAPIDFGPSSDADGDTDTDADSDTDTDADTDTEPEAPPLETFNQASKRYASLFDPSVLHAVTITFTEANWKVLQETGAELPASVAIDGEVLPLAGVELAGDQAGFGWDGKVDLRLDFDQYFDGLTYGGMEHLVFDDQAADPTGVREVIANRVLIAAGVSTPRAGFATVQVQGGVPLLYTLREEVDVAFLQRWWAPTGPLWEAEDGADFTVAGLPGWTGGTVAEDALLESARVAIQTSGADFEAQVGAVLDLEQARAVWAWQAVLGNSDGWPYELDDVWLYGDPGQANRFVFLPHRVDEGFDPLATWDAVAPEVAVRCRFDAACDALLRTTILAAADEYEAVGVGTWAQEAFDLTEAAMLADPAPPIPPAQMLAERALLLPIVETRPTAVRDAVN